VPKNDDWVTVRISSQEKAELERLAREEERSVNGMIRVAVRMLIESRREEFAA